MIITASVFLLLVSAAAVSACPVHDSATTSTPVKVYSLHLHTSKKDSIADANFAPKLSFPPEVKKLRIDVGPNDTPLKPPKNDPSVAVLAVEPNVAIAHHLRETFQKKAHPGRFFVVNCALAGRPMAGRISAFNHYNERGMSSSLASVMRKPDGRVHGFADRARHDPSEKYGPGPAGVDIVPVLSLQALLDAVPSNIEIQSLKTDAQGFDLDVVKSASPRSLRRIKKIVSETYLEGIGAARYEGVRNDLERDWVPYMKKVGFKLSNPTKKTNREYDAHWIRSV